MRHNRLVSGKFGAGTRSTAGTNCSLPAGRRFVSDVQMEKKSKLSHPFFYTVSDFSTLEFVADRSFVQVQTGSGATGNLRKNSANQINPKLLP
jgi:hypothetical protein